MGPYKEERLEVGATQVMTLDKVVSDDPPFYDPDARREAVQKKGKDKTISELKAELEK